MATLDDDGWELLSAEEQHAQFPDRFWIPPHEQRVRLRPGDRAKLLFLFYCERNGVRTQHEGMDMIQCERMWVFVCGSSDGTYEGTLYSEPVSSKVLRPGARVNFGPEHVADIAAQEAEDASWIGQRCPRCGGPLRQKSCRACEINFPRALG